MRASSIDRRDFCRFLLLARACASLAPALLATLVLAATSESARAEEFYVVPPDAIREPGDEETRSPRPLPDAENQRCVILKNGNIVHGEVTESGDYLIVTQADQAELRLAADKIEMICDSLEDAFLRKRTEAIGDGMNARLHVVHWAIRHRLFDAAEAEIDRLAADYPSHHAPGQLRKKLEFSRQAPAPMPVRKLADRPADDARVEAPRVRKVPKEAMEQFLRSVQPIVVRGCGSVRCHGGACDSFQLTYSPLAKGFSAQATQRNLKAVLEHVDLRRPEESPLLAKSLEPHGGATKAPFADERTRPYVALAAWIEQMAQARAAQPRGQARMEEEAAEAKNVDAEIEVDLEEDDARELGPITEPREPGRLPNAVQRASAEMPLDEEDARLDAEIERDLERFEKKHGLWKPPAKPSKPGFVPKDPFDPEIFNRRNHGE